MLWSEGGRTWFWGGGGKLTPFKVGVSSDSGATWQLWLPNANISSATPTPLASQPITTVLRDTAGSLYVGVDSAGASSGLWKSTDDGISWENTEGRTVGRHTTFFTSPASSSIPSGSRVGQGHESNSTTPAAAAAGQTIFAYGGKNSNIDGYMPFTFSTDGGASFAHPGAKLPFPALGSNQRCVAKKKCE